MPNKFSIKVPASSANIGPGFDVLGIGLNLYLEVNVQIDSSLQKEGGELDKYNCKLTYEGQGAENVPLASDANLVTNTALYVLRCHDIFEFPQGTHIHVKNPIPLGRGLGSSGAAIVAGVMIANGVADLGLSKTRLLDFCLMIERHPDNIAAAMLGGFVGSFLRELNEGEIQPTEIPMTDVLPKASTSKITDSKPPVPPMNLGSYVQYDWCKQIKCVTIIPNFEVSTDNARAVLPSSYSRDDVVFNLQRLAVLTTALTRSPPDANLIYSAMQDKIHQPYRQALIPGLTEITTNLTPQTCPGLLGICLSGAGPTILALATENFDQIAESILSIFKKNDISCLWKILEPAYDGAEFIQ